MLEGYDISKKFKAVVKKNEHLTSGKGEEEVRNLVLEVEPGVKLDAGNNVGVLVPGPHEFGNEYHFRLYAVAGVLSSQEPLQVEMCVKRCFYIDDFNGERYKGVASNYLCDRQVNDEITLTGPYQSAFQVPEDSGSNLLLIAQGTGIAPFRAFVRHIYEDLGGWKGKVRLFYGGKTGMEMLYMNDKKDDFVNYYDEATFRAFQAVSPRPSLNAPIDFENTFEQNAKEIWEMILDPNTHVYVAGLQKMSEQLKGAFIKVAGSEEKWDKRKAELVAGGRWVELLY